MNSSNLGARIAEMELWMKRYGLWKLSGVKRFLGGSGVILRFLEWLEGFGTKNRGSCKIWGFLGVFGVV
jgi:hypothetical protein